MKIKIIALIQIFIIVGLFSGCTMSNYNIEPKVVENNKIIFENYLLQNIKILESGKKNYYFGNINTITFKTDSGIIGSESRYYGSKYISWFSLKESLEELAANKEIFCNAVKINNLTFFDCTKDVSIDINENDEFEIKYMKKIYYIQSIYGNDTKGYRNSTKLTIDNKNDYYSMLEHFKQEAKKNEIKITKYDIGNKSILKDSSEVEIYEGEYHIKKRSNDPSSKQCSSKGKILFHIMNNERVNGAYTNRLWHKYKDFQFASNLEYKDFQVIKLWHSGYGSLQHTMDAKIQDSRIVGKYINLGGSCSGEFSAKLVEQKKLQSIKYD